MQTDRFKHIAKALPVSIVVSNFLTPLAYYGILRLLHQDTSAAGAWLLGGIALCLLRLFIIRDIRNFTPTLDSPVLWEKKLTFNALLGGLFWAVGGIITINPDNPELNAIMIVAMATSLSSASVAYVSFINMYRAFVLGMCVPLIPYFLSLGEAFYYLAAILGGLVAFINYIYAKTMAKSYSESLALRNQNLLLIDNLNILKTKAEDERLIAEEASATKSRFLAIASHDLRQPLNAISLIIDRLLTKEHAPETQTVLGIMRESADAQKNLLSSLLDVSRLDSGTIVPKIASINLSTLLTKLCMEYQLRAIESDIQLRSRFAYRSHSNELLNFDVYVNTDRGLLEQALRNLMANAIKYTHANGAVLVGLRVYDTHVLLQVWDTGIGIPQADQQRIYQEFFQVKQLSSNDQSGAGLGLSIVHRISDLLSLPLRMNSQADSGSVFSIELPLAESPEIENNTATISTKDTDLDLRGTSVLIVEDDIANLQVLELTLSDWGCHLRTANDAKEFHRIFEDFDPDIVITDYNFDVKMTGIDVIAFVREDTGFNVPAIITTGTTSKALIFDYQEPITEVLIKPINAKLLRETMTKLLNRAPVD